VEGGALGQDGQVNFLRGAIVHADRVTTVSPTYAREIRSVRGGFGLDAVLRECAGKLTGVLNGIDYRTFDPSTDLALAARYDAGSPFEGKARCKVALATEFGLSPGGGPILASVSRLDEHKGVDLLVSVIPALVERGARVVLVGSGEPPLEAALRSVALRFPGRVTCRIAFDGQLARRVYAGADFLMVPSRSEPCGLTQLYAMRYGTLPVVTDVGGLHDTVEPMRAVLDTGTGWLAARPEPSALLVACEDALTHYGDRASHRAAVQRAMARDSSWDAPASAYARIYEELFTG
jgi:starch synthase